MGVSAGAMRHWLMFETLVSPPEMDSDGAIVEEWVPAFATGSRMPAEVVPLSGRELIAAGAVQSKVTHRIKVRYRNGFTATMRATERAIVYGIAAVIPDPESGFEFVTLLATSGVDQGGTA